MPFVLVIRERGSSWAGRDPIAVVHPSRDEAKPELVDYVRENWDTRMDEAPPENEDELVGRYFDNVLEAYDIAETA